MILKFAECSNASAEVFGDMADAAGENGKVDVIVWIKNILNTCRSEKSVYDYDLKKEASYIPFANCNIRYQGKWHNILADGHIALGTNQTIRELEKIPESDRQFPNDKILIHIDDFEKTLSINLDGAPDGKCLMENFAISTDLLNKIYAKCLEEKKNPSIYVEEAIAECLNNKR